MFHLCIYTDVEGEEFYAQAPVVTSQRPLVPSVLLHFLLGLSFILEGLQTPTALHLGLVTQTLAVLAGLFPQGVPPIMKVHCLVQQKFVAASSHCSLGSRAPFPQRDVAV